MGASDVNSGGHDVSGIGGLELYDGQIIVVLTLGSGFLIGVVLIEIDNHRNERIIWMISASNHKLVFSTTRGSILSFGRSCWPTHTSS